MAKPSQYSSINIFIDFYFQFIHDAYDALHWIHSQIIFTAHAKHLNVHIMEKKPRILVLFWVSSSVFICWWCIPFKINICFTIFFLLSKSQRMWKIEWEWSSSWWHLLWLCVSQFGFLRRKMASVFCVLYSKVNMQYSIYPIKAEMLQKYNILHQISKKKLHISI